MGGEEIILCLEVSLLFITILPCFSPFDDILGIIPFI